MKKEPITLGIADDNAIFITAFKRILDRFADIKLVLEANTIPELLKKLRRVQPRFLLLDYSMPDNNFSQMMAQLEPFRSRTEILVVTAYEDFSILDNSFNHGVKAFLPKSHIEEEFPLAIASLSCNTPYTNRWMGDALTQRYYRDQLNEQIPYHTLSDQDIQLLNLMAQDLSSVEIAQVMSQSKRTVDNYKKRLRKKVKVTNNEDLLIYAQSRGLIFPVPENQEKGSKKS
jgi:DNA-binding NarL/FixJ family response regulator